MGAKVISRVSTTARWWVLATVSVAAVVVACSATRSVQPGPPGPPGLSVAATASLIGNPDTVQVRLRVLNIGADTQTVGWDHCMQTGPANAIRAYLPGTRQLKWDWFPAYAASACDLLPYVKLLNPGDSVVIRGHVPTADMLGDSLAAGPYDLTLTPKYLEPSAPEEISLGRFTLAR